MKNPQPFRLLLLTLGLLTGCSAAKRDELWQVLDPAGYKHAHSESFNGARALKSPRPAKDSDEMALELPQ